LVIADWMLIADWWLIATCEGRHHLPELSAAGTNLTRLIRTLYGRAALVNEASYNLRRSPATCGRNGQAIGDGPFKLAFSN
jgi:hypothetical protein